MTCRELVDFLSDFVAGELPEPQASVFAEHVRICPPCEAYLESFRETLRLERTLCREPGGELPADVPADLVRAILAARVAGE